MIRREQIDRANFIKIRTNSPYKNTYTIRKIAINIKSKIMNEQVQLIYAIRSISFAEDVSDDYY